MFATIIMKALQHGIFVEINDLYLFFPGTRIRHGGTVICFGAKGLKKGEVNPLL